MFEGCSSFSKRHTFAIIRHFKQQFILFEIKHDVNNSCHYERVYVLTRVGTRVVNRACATMIVLKRDSTYSGRFQNGSRIIFH